VTSFKADSFLKNRADESTRTRISALFFHSAVASPWSRIKILPPSSGRDWFFFSIVACVLKPVVAPQLREKITILRLPSGDTNSEIMSLEQGSHPERASSKIQAIYTRRIFLANVRDDGSPPAFGADPASAGSVTKVPKAW